MLKRFPSTRLALLSNEGERDRDIARELEKERERERTRERNIKREQVRREGEREGETESLNLFASTVAFEVGR